MLFTLSVPPDNDRGPQYMEQALAAIHQANPKRLQIEFGFGFQRGTVAIRCRVPAELAVTVTSQLTAHYPAATMERLAEWRAMPAGFQTRGMELRLHPDLFPVRRYVQFDDPLNRNVSDPLTGIFATLAAVDSTRFQAMILMTTQPAKSRRVRQARKAIRRMASPLFRQHHALSHWYASSVTSRQLATRLLARAVGLLSGASGNSAGVLSLAASSARAHDREDDLQAAADKLGRYLFETHIRLSIIGMSATPQIGLALTANNDGTVATAVFSDVTITANTGTLAAPANLTASLGTANGVNLSWDAVSGATGYVVERSWDGTTFTRIGSTTSTSYSDTDPGGSQYWSYRVAATDATGICTPSTAVSIVNRPAAASDVRMDLVGSNTLVLDWDDTPVIGETGYRVERSTDDVTWTTLAVLPPNSVSYTDSSLGPGHALLLSPHAHQRFGGWGRGGRLRQYADGRAGQAPIQYPSLRRDDYQLDRREWRGQLPGGTLYRRLDLYSSGHVAC